MRHQQFGRYRIQHLGKILRAIRFTSFQAAEKWGLWNYKGRHENWRVVKVKELGQSTLEA